MAEQAETRSQTARLLNLALGLLSLLALIWASSFTLIRITVDEVPPFALIGFMPLATALIAHVAIADERLTPLRLAGVALGVAGIVVLAGADALKNLGHHVLAELAIVGAALSYAVNTVLVRRGDDDGLRTGHSPSGHARYRHGRPARDDVRQFVPASSTSSSTRCHP